MVHHEYADQSRRTLARPTVVLHFGDLDGDYREVERKEAMLTTAGDIGKRQITLGASHGLVDHGLAVA